MGTRYKGTLCLAYTELDATAAHRTVCGDISARFEPPDTSFATPTPVSCSDDSNCSSSKWCDIGVTDTCLPDKADGQPCNRNAQCINGNCSGGTCQPPAAPPGPGWFYGTITNGTGSAVSGATVNATNATGSYTNTTNATGDYIIYGLSAGSGWDVNASKTGLKWNSTSGQAISSDAGTQVDLQLFPTPSLGVLLANCTTIGTPGNYTISPSFAQPTQESDLIPCITAQGGTLACICIDSDNVKLDCGGETVSGIFQGSPPFSNYYVGIGSNGRSNVQINNCKVSHWSEGVLAVEGDNVAISSCTADNCTYSFDFEGSTNPITNVAASGNSASSGSIGLEMYMVSGGTASSNTIRDTTSSGIYTGSTNGVTFTSNTVCGASGNDFSCDSGQTDGNGNVCTPEGVNAACSGTVTCNAGCLLPPGPITSCPARIRQPGTYTLIGDLTSTGTCITIEGPGGDNAVLNCNNHVITGSGVSDTYGIYVKAADGVTVENCRPTNFATGIQLEGDSFAYTSTDYATITGNVCNSNTGTGIGVFNNASNNHVTGNTCNSNSYGIVLGGPDILNNIVSGNTVNDNTYAGIENDFYGYMSGNTHHPSGNNMTGNTIVNSAPGGGYWDMYCNTCPYGTCYNPTRTGNYCNTPNKACSSCAPPGTCTKNLCNPAPPPIIYSCGTTITDSQSYTLGNALVATPGQTCITFSPTSTASLNCNSQTITGAGSGTGVLFNSVNSGALYNCVISGFTAGVSLVNSQNVYAYGNTVSGCAQGMGFSSSNGNDIESNGVTGSSTADFYCTGTVTSSTYESGNTCGTQSGCDAWLSSCPPAYVTACGMVITDSRAYALSGPLTASPGQTCITFDSGSGATVDCGGQTITGAGSGTGVLFDSNSGNWPTLGNCVISGFTSGVSFSNSNEIYAHDNTITGGTKGMEFISSNDNDIENNAVTGGGTADFYCSGTVLSSTYEYGNTCGTQSGCANPPGWLSSCPPLVCDYDSVCDPAEGCACSDCYGEHATECAAGRVCIAGTCTGPIAILSCGYSPAPAGGYITSSGYYTLTGPLTNTGVGACITIDAPNVVLDCGGIYPIFGSGGGLDNGIDFGSMNTVNMIVRNCHISGFGNGIIGWNAFGSGNTLKNNVISSSAQYDIQCGVSTPVTRTGNTCNSANKCTGCSPATCNAGACNT